MFNLEKQISAWRSQMLAAGLQTPVPLDELETHLRDDIARQIKSGLGETEAFQLAIQKLGPAATLKSEFEIARAPLNARARKLIFAFVVFSLVSLSMLILPVFKVGSFSEMDALQQLSGIAAIVTALLLGLAGWFGHRFFLVFSGKRAKAAVIISATALWMLWNVAFLWVIALRFDFTIGGFGAAFLWSFAALGGLLFGLHFGIERAAVRRAIA